MNLRAIKQAVEDYAHDRIGLAQLELELEYAFGIRERPIVPVNYVEIVRGPRYQLERAAYYGLPPKDAA